MAHAGVAGQGDFALGVGHVELTACGLEGVAMQLDVALETKRPQLTVGKIGHGRVTASAAQDHFGFEIEELIHDDVVEALCLPQVAVDKISYQVVCFDSAAKT